nr:mannose-6-phosphate isomerase, class I [Propionibacterium sp.]
MQEIHGTVMHFPWGTADAIPAILGVQGDGRPFAEYWLGAHAVGPSRVNGTRLDELIAADPSILGPVALRQFGGRFPFLMKILSARHALSLQAHPARAEAAEGFAAEEAAGLALDDPRRCFKDDWAKPETLIALTDFRLLLGFRTPTLTYALFEQLGLAQVLDSVIGPLKLRRGPAATEEVFLETRTLEGDRLELVNRVLVAAVAHADDPGPAGDLARLIIELDEFFPGDPGIIAACLMNLVTLRPGQAIHVPAGQMHAHLSGTGIELMANSDNVLRGGLTAKHIAVDALVRAVDFGESSPRVLNGTERSPGVWSYPSECPEFDVWRIECGPDPISLPAHGAVRIALVTSGDVVLEDARTRLDLEHGQAVLIPADNPPVRLWGHGQVFLSAPGIR